jgi:hypothetical protein
VSRGGGVTDGDGDVVQQPQQLRVVAGLVGHGRQFGKAAVIDLADTP